MDCNEASLECNFYIYLNLNSDIILFTQTETNKIPKPYVPIMSTDFNNTKYELRIMCKVPEWDTYIKSLSPRAQGVLWKRGAERL